AYRAEGCLRLQRDALHRGSTAMKFFFFHLMPYSALDLDFDKKYPTDWVVLPNSYYDPVKGHELYNRYLDELEYAETLGIFELVEIAVVELVPLDRIVVAVRQHHPVGRVLLIEVEIEGAVGHQMEEEEFHRRAPSMKRVTLETKTSFRSIC